MVEAGKEGMSAPEPQKPILLESTGLLFTAALTRDFLNRVVTTLGAHCMPKALGGAITV